MPTISLLRPNVEYGLNKQVDDVFFSEIPVVLFKGGMHKGVTTEDTIAAIVLL